ncbi:YqhA family protein [Polynucleobacter sp.]|uniref:YqhA family protein n=1 Tax=Polynucleobacter sp. TaxID=2029855 RepID=UPI00333EB960
MSEQMNTQDVKSDDSGHFEVLIEKIIFRSRWILAGFYLLLVATLFLVAIKFVKEFAHFAMIFWYASEAEFVTGVLEIVDKTLLGNLLILIIFSGYENFVSVIGAAKNSTDRPKWMGGVDFAGLKLKLIGSIVALSGINLLAAFLEISTTNKENLGWMVGIHLTFVVTGLIFALSERYMHQERH